jgi:hypothetical protein
MRERKLSQPCGFQIRSIFEKTDVLLLFLPFELIADKNHNSKSYIITNNKIIPLKN